MKRFDRDRLVLAVAAPVLAVLGGLIVTALVLLATGKEPFHAFDVMVSYGTQVRQPGLHPQQGDHVLPGAVSRSPSASG